MMLIFDEFVQVDKNDARFSDFIFLCKILQ